jgi:uncharacterized protein YcbK (DUF882 family)
MDDWGLTQHAAHHLVHLLAAVAGVTVSSGRRSPERNRAVGGSPGSFHLKGRAVDLVGDRGSLDHAARHAREARVTQGCTGPEEVLMESDHLHLAW